MTTKCKGKNCNSTDGTNHSLECIAEHEACIEGAMTTQDMHREAFEKWYSQDFYDGICPPPVWDGRKNTYERFEDHLAWHAFQQGMRYRDELEKGK